MRIILGLFFNLAGLAADLRRHIFFVDDNLINHRGRFKELLEAILPLGRVFGLARL